MKLSGSPGVGQCSKQLNRTMCLLTKQLGQQLFPEKSQTGVSLYCFLGGNYKSRRGRNTAFLLQVLYSLVRLKSLHINPERDKYMKRREKQNLHWRNVTAFINVFCSNWNSSFITLGALSQSSPQTQRASGPCQKSI